jgi:hypothetical protein
MGWFRRQVPASEPQEQIVGLAARAASRGWQAIPDGRIRSGLADSAGRLTWTLYDRRYAPLADATPTSSHVTQFQDAYGGEVDGRRVVVANGWTNIGPQQIVKTHVAMGVSVCAVELGAFSPLVLVQPRELPPAASHVPVTPTGDTEFDGRFVVILSPAVTADAMTPAVRQQVMIHDDWAFAGDEDWLACVGRGPFESADDVDRRLHEVLDVVAAFPVSVLPARIDRSVDDLAARIEKLSTVEDAIAFLQQLTPDDRQRLAQSDTPLAAFADVTTPEQAMTRFESLNPQQRMQLLGMFQRVDQ